MTGLLVAILLSQARGTPPPQTQRPGINVSEAGTPKGRATAIDFAGGATVAVTGTTASVTVTGGGGGGGAPTTAQYWTGAADGTLSAEKNLGALSTGLVLNTAGVPSAYAGSACTTPNVAQTTSASGVLGCYQLKLDDLANPSATKTFTMANKALKFTWTAPTAGGGIDGAFELEATGAYTGDLLHVHQHTGSPVAGVDLAHFEAASTNVLPLRLTAASSSTQAAVITGLVTADGYSGPLTGNASTATALAANGSNCSAGSAAGGVDASGASEACTAYVTPTYGANTNLTAAAATSGVTTVSSPTSGWNGSYWDGASSQGVAFTSQVKVTSNAGPAYAWTLRDASAGADRLTVNQAGVVAAPGGFSGALTGNATTATALTLSPKVITSNVTNSTTTPANIAGLTWSVTSGVEYGFLCTITHLGTATSGPRFNVNGPAMTQINVKFETHTAPTTTPVKLHVTAISAAASTAACTSSCNATVMTSRISGTFVPSASGTAAVMLTSSTAGQTVTVYRGSHCDVR